MKDLRDRKDLTIHDAEPTHTSCNCTGKGVFVIVLSSGQCGFSAVQPPSVAALEVGGSRLSRLLPPCPSNASTSDSSSVRLNLGLSSLVEKKDLWRVE